MSKIFTGAGLVTVEVVGDSMTERGIYDGDMVVVRQMPETPDNSVVLAWVPSNEGGGLTIKKYAHGMLYPETKNDAHEPMELPRDARIYGVYEGLVRRHRTVKKRRRRV